MNSRLTGKARAAGRVPSPDAFCAFPLLASASVVGRYCLPDGCGELPHVTRRIDAFLSVLSPSWTLTESYKRTGSLRLLQYLAARESKASVGVDPFYRRWLFNGATELAAERGDLEALRLLMERDLPNEFLTKAVAAAASKGHLHILEWLYEAHHDRGYWGCTEMCGAMKNHHHDVVAWLRIHAVPREQSSPEVLQAAASAGYLDVVQWLHKERRVSAAGALDCAMSGKQWETAWWILESIDKKRDWLDWTGAIDDGALPFLKLLLSHKIRHHGHDIITSAAAYGHLEIIE
ncbi:hypothetical protein BBJ28_00015529 [Nothophytophthora sp. Chile5]|nr:hypothetical protein BBJ28_00015529 [Nothophytophthora sp. Chile5]